MLLQSSLSIDSRTDVFDTCHTAVIRNMSAILTFVGRREFRTRHDAGVNTIGTAIAKSASAKISTATSGMGLVSRSVVGPNGCAQLYRR